MQASYRIGSNAETRRGEYPVRVHKVVEKSEILETSIGGIKPIQLRLLNVNPQITVGIRTPPGRSHQQRVEHGALALFSSHQKAGVKKARPGLVVKVAPILVEIAIDSDTAIANFYAGGDGVVTSILAGFYRSIWRLGFSFLWRG